jgi:2-polyprenyl-3-methyl-5-hydroxy-6-metoxy-1,4-benzoquinol methylase
MLNYKNLIQYPSISNEDALNGSDMSEEQKQSFIKSDLISGVYEGGLKVWECTFDMLDFLAKYPVQGKTVMELGCGQGLPAIFCAMNGAKKVCMQDYNATVIEKATKTAASINLSEQQMQSVDFLSGSWEQLIHNPSLSGQFDLIIMCETLYNKEYYPSLINFIKYCASENAIVLIATKTFYYGLGGGFYDFEQFSK